jgi:hypothetical protein
MCLLLRAAVHRHFLVDHSEVIRGMVTLPPNPEDGKEMEVTMSGDSVVGWECLLGLFYPK